MLICGNLVGDACRTHASKKVQWKRPDGGTLQGVMALTSPRAILVLVASARGYVLPPPGPLHRHICWSRHASLPPAGRTAIVASSPVDPEPEQKPKSKQDRFELQFTCNVCESRNVHSISKHAYTKGTVIVTCPNCNSTHLVADNLNCAQPLIAVSSIAQLTCAACSLLTVASRDRGRLSKSGAVHGGAWHPGYAHCERRRSFYGGGGCSSRCWCARGARAATAATAKAYRRCHRRAGNAHSRGRARKQASSAHTRTTTRRAHRRELTGFDQRHRSKAAAYCTRIGIRPTERPRCDAPSAVSDSVVITY